MNERKEMAWLVPEEIDGLVIFHGQYRDASILNGLVSGENMWIRNCKEGDLTPGQIKILRPVEQRVPETSEEIHYYWEIVTGEEVE